MIIKFAGAAFVFCAAALAGMYYGSLESFRAADLLELKKALSILRAEIEFAHAPLTEALISIVQRVPGPVGGIFLRMEELLHVERNANASELWEQSVKERIGRTYLNSEDELQLLSFGKALGFLGADMQLTNITLLSDYINGRLELLNKSRHKSRRMFQSLGILAGLLIVVILI